MSHIEQLQLTLPYWQYDGHGGAKVPRVGVYITMEIDTLVEQVEATTIRWKPRKKNTYDMNFIDYMRISTTIMSFPTNEE